MSLRTHVLTRIPDSDPLVVDLRHDYGDDATLLANFLTVPHPTLRQQAAITLLCMAVRADGAVPVVIEDAVEVLSCAIASVAIAGVAPSDRRSRVFAIHWANRCATLAHLACRAFARHQVAEPTGAVDQHALLAIGEACAEVMAP
jgi:hypothetical protein